jgi:hypothetical protein
MSQQDPQFIAPAPNQHPPKPPNRRRGWLIVAGSVAAFLAIVAIGGALTDGVESQATSTRLPNVVSTPTADTTTAPPAVPSPAPETTEPSTAAEQEADDTSTIGGRWLTYESGLAVRVVKAKLYTPGEYAAGKKAGERGVAVTVSIKNGSAAAFDAGLASVKLSYGPDGTEADEIFDSAYNYGLGFEGSIGKGKTKTATVAFSVPAKYAKQLTVEVEPDWSSVTTFFTGSAK